MQPWQATLSPFCRASSDAIRLVSCIAFALDQYGTAIVQLAPSCVTARVHIVLTQLLDLINKPDWSSYAARQNGQGTRPAEGC